MSAAPWVRLAHDTQWESELPQYMAKSALKNSVMVIRGNNLESHVNLVGVYF